MSWLRRSFNTAVAHYPLAATLDRAPEGSLFRFSRQLLEHRPRAVKHAQKNRPGCLSRGVRSLACVWRSVFFLLFEGLVSGFASS